jgi:hypothetical protein
MHPSGFGEKATAARRVGPNTVASPHPVLFREAQMKIRSVLALAAVLSLAAAAASAGAVRRGAHDVAQVGRAGGHTVMDAGRGVGHVFMAAGRGVGRAVDPDHHRKSRRHR